MVDSGKKGGVQSRIGKRFHEEIQKVRKRILFKTSLNNLSMEEVTNLLTRHKLWTQLAEDVGNIKEEEIKQYGK